MFKEIVQPFKTLVEQFQVKIRQESTSTASNVGRLRAVHNLDGIFADLRDNVVAKLTEFDSRFVDVAKSERSMRKSHFYRARHLVEKLEREKLSLFFLLHRHVETMLEIVSCRATSTTPTPNSSSHNDWLYVLECADQVFKKQLFLLNKGSLEGELSVRLTSLSLLARIRLF